MSFSHFRLGQLAFANTLPPHLQGANEAVAPAGQNEAQFISQTTNTNSSISDTKSPYSTKAPYGSGIDEDYTLVFPNMEAFNAWRQQEEETQVVEFVKGDSHTSKALPPRFKEHTKLVCARHSRSGRKKYVKKHPERIRKVPSRKIEGGGCPASISYKTYFDTDEVRACYVSEHSHETGPANLPFTRRGRKSLAAAEKERPKKTTTEPPSTPTASSSSTTQPTFTPVAAPQLPAPFTQPPIFGQAQLPFGPQYAPPPPPPPFPLPQGMGQSRDRWENMTSLFNGIREHARTFEYPPASIAALETVLVRLYLESPVQGYAGHPPPMPPFVGGMGAPNQAPQQRNEQDQNNESGAEKRGSEVTD